MQKECHRALQSDLWMNNFSDSVVHPDGATMLGPLKIGQSLPEIRQSEVEQDQTWAHRFFLFFENL